MSEVPLWGGGRFRVGLYVPVSVRSGSSKNLEDLAASPLFESSLDALS